MISQVAIVLPNLPLDHIIFLVRNIFNWEGIWIINLIKPVSNKPKRYIFLKKYNPRDWKKSNHNLKYCSILFRPEGLNPSKLNWKNLLEEGRLIVKAIVLIICKKHIFCLGSVNSTSKIHT